ncbi:MAG: SLBB domain-containing protein [Parachlamydiaceae bacterium]
MHRSPALKIHEWLAIVMTIGILGSIALVTSLYQPSSEIRTQLPGKINRDGFDILIRGAVKHPGVYHFHSQIKMKEILEIAGVLPMADLRRYRLDTFVTKGRVITVPAVTMISIHVRGAVKQEGSIRVPKGTKLQDLLSLVELADDAEIQFLQKKRNLLPDEVIDIPYESS